MRRGDSRFMHQARQYSRAQPSIVQSLPVTNHGLARVTAFMR
jgi:hypothetical protein